MSEVYLCPIFIFASVFISGAILYCMGYFEGKRRTRKEAMNCVIVSGKRDNQELTSKERLVAMYARKQILEEMRDRWKLSKEEK
jgi:hypothetical protein